MTTPTNSSLNTLLYNEKKYGLSGTTNHVLDCHTMVVPFTFYRSSVSIAHVLC